ncbi:pyridoxamine 5'-phosphate oxidase family protein [Paenibacillus puerhi]|uniref:pyridoxamine 5'-phosphate oxidase family protein n=1 Tax=Paenibacillus puerhi TaxID=2692622 RepID=UPI00135CE708|nr:pyridoxamine 5'-phosphate oxidase family protein [Paenibacillus puerhi]
MRRSDFEITEQQEIESFLAEMSFGILGTQGEDGWPELTPLNFVYHEGAIYFHGSKVGQKMTNLKKEARVTFSVSQEFARIPSYFLDPKLACPATAYFKSVLIKGYGEIVEDLQEKASALSAFMSKLQAEGGYETIDPGDADYAGQLRATAVVRIRVETMSAKFKFGQNLTDRKRDKVTAGLENRDAPLDAETLALMKQFCPHHRE